jgi:hypothetical protein
MTNLFEEKKIINLQKDEAIGHDRCNNEFLKVVDNQ